MKGHQRIAQLLTLAFLLVTGGCAHSGLVGYWKLHGDCRDYSGYDNDGINHGVTLSEAGAAFDGLNHYIEVPDHPSLHLGTGDFTITAWVKCDSRLNNVTGDILNKFDPDRRCGFNLDVIASSPGYSSLSDQRNLLFGIDNAKEGLWMDCGRPWPSNMLISTLIVYKGQLYTGIADASKPEDTCHMFRYDGGQKWIDCGRVGGDRMKNVSVFSVVVHQGQLYAGTGIWDWSKVWMGKGATSADPAQVYRYVGGTTWEDCGQLKPPSSEPAFRVSSLASFNGQLYASDNTDAVYRYDGNKHWTVVGRPGSIKYDQAHPAGDIVAMMPYQGHLYGVKHFASVFRYMGGTKWDDIGQVFHDLLEGKYHLNNIHTLAVYHGNLYIGTWPDGRVLRYEGGQNWADCGGMGVEGEWRPGERANEVNDLTVYNGKMYAGVIPLAEVWRYEDGTQWTRVKQLVHNPDWELSKVDSWNRIPSMAIFQGRLYCGTSSCYGGADADPKCDAGKVFSFEAGKCITDDNDLGSQWRQIAAVRHQDHLKLYVDGRLVTTSTAFNPADYNLSNDRPLLIGFGQENYFNGSIRDVRLYHKALSAAQIESLK